MKKQIKVKKQRSIATDHRRTKLDPRDVLIAGEDFKPTEDQAWLVDESSEARETIDPWFSRALNDHGNYLTVYCVPVILTRDQLRPIGRQLDHDHASMLIAGSIDDRFKLPWAVAIGGRRTVRHMRAFNGQIGQSPPRKVTIHLFEKDVTGWSAFKLARLLNRPGMPETPKQILGYVGACDEEKEPDEAILQLLGITKSQLATYRKIRSANMPDFVVEAMDSWLSISVAAKLAGVKTFTEREKIFTELKIAHERGQKVTISMVVGYMNGNGQVRRVRPSAKSVKVALEFDRCDLSERERNLLLFGVTGDRELLEGMPGLLELLDGG